MNKKILIIAGIVVAVCVAIVGIVFAVINANKTPATPGVENNPKTPVAEIDLNTKQYIKQLEQVKIKGTNDTVMITKQVKWEVPEHEPGVLVEFEIAEDNQSHSDNGNGDDDDFLLVLLDKFFGTVDDICHLGVFFF